MSRQFTYEELIRTNAPQCPSGHRNNDAERDEDGVIMFVCRDCGRVGMCSPETYLQFFSQISYTEGIN